MTTSAVLAKQLTYLLGERRRKFRPLRWRNFVRLRTGIPSWAERVEVIKLTENAQEPIPWQDGTANKAPVPSFDRNSGYFGVAEYALAYQIFQTELDRAAVTGVNVPDVKVNANQRSTEEFLDKIAAYGTTAKLVGTVGSGLLRSTDVPLLAAGSDNSGFPIVGNWGDSTADQEILDDVGNLIEKVNDNSSEVHTANRVILPDTKYRYVAKRKTENSDRSLLSVMQEMNPGVRFDPWRRARLAGGTFTAATLSGTATRAMALDDSEDVVTFVMVHEMQDGEPLKIHRGYEVLQTVRFGGVVFEQPKGAAYADGI